MRLCEYKGMSAFVPGLVSPFHLLKLSVGINHYRLAQPSGGLKAVQVLVDHTSAFEMGVPPNKLYTAFSFVGFVMCAIPFYWHLEGS